MMMTRMVFSYTYVQQAYYIYSICINYGIIRGVQATIVKGLTTIAIKSETRNVKS